MEIVVATSNYHKLQELRKILPESFNIKGMIEIGCATDIPETGATFKENALLKARYLYERFQCNTLADDSGLEVQALNGLPGVISARYAGPQANATENLSKLLIDMKGFTNRSARFKTVLAYIAHGKEYFFEGVISGTIREKPAGTSGFGYDPVFVPDGYTKTFSEMTSDEKNRISHRGVAAKAFRIFLESANNRK